MPVSTAPTSSPSQPELSRILKLKVPVIVRVARRRMAVGDIMRRSLGSILEFNQPADAPLKLMVNNTVIGEGEAVKIGEKFGLRITDIGDVQERIEALAG